MKDLRGSVGRCFVMRADHPGVHTRCDNIDVGTSSNQGSEMRMYRETLIEAAYNVVSSYLENASGKFTFIERDGPTSHRACPKVLLTPSRPEQETELNSPGGSMSATRQGVRNTEYLCKMHLHQAVRARPVYAAAKGPNICQNNSMLAMIHATE